MDPPESVAIEAIARPAATPAAEPLLDSPGGAARFQGLRAGLTKSCSEVPLNANSLSVALPSVTAPLRIIRPTTWASFVGTHSPYTREAAVVRTPAVAIRSL